MQKTRKIDIIWRYLISNDFFTMSEVAEKSEVRLETVYAVFKALNKNNLLVIVANAKVKKNICYSLETNRVNSCLSYSNKGKVVIVEDIKSLDEQIERTALYLQKIYETNELSTHQACKELDIRGIELNTMLSNSSLKSLNVKDIAEYIANEGN